LHRPYLVQKTHSTKNLPFIAGEYDELMTEQIDKNIAVKSESDVMELDDKFYY